MSTYLVPLAGIEPTCVRLPFHLLRRQRGYKGSCVTHWLWFRTLTFGMLVYYFMLVFGIGDRICTCTRRHVLLPLYPFVGY